MQVVLLVIPEDVDAVASPRDVLDVQRLMEVADEMDYKLGSLGTAPWWQDRVKGLLGVVGQRGDDAARGFAVALQVDVARLGRVVVGVDEVKVLCEVAPFGVADGICPACNLGEVVGLVVAQELLQVRLGGVGDEVRG